MGRFIVRVELHGGDEEDYEILYNEMSKRHLYKTIPQDTDGTIFKLPTAEYYYEGQIEDKREIHALAEDSVIPTRLRSSILVTKSAGIFFSGLEIDQ